MRINIYLIVFFVPFFNSCGGDSKASKQGESTDSSTADQDAAKGKPFHIVSDLDDTLKITDVANPLGSIFNGLLSEDSFAGMSKLINKIAEKALTFDLVSGSPTLVIDRVESFLATNDYPRPKEIYLNDRLGRESSEQHKISTLEMLFKENKAGFILIGDDTELDPKIYQDLDRKYPGKVLAIYIKKVTGQTLIKIKTNSFTSAFDVAYWEMLAGRLSEEAVIEVGESILEADEKLPRPSFVVCPKEGDRLVLDLHPDLSDLYENIWSKLKKGC